MFLVILPDHLCKSRTPGNLGEPNSPSPAIRQHRHPLPFVRLSTSPVRLHLSLVSHRSWLIARRPLRITITRLRLVTLRGFFSYPLWVKGYLLIN
jgi:hypothetical protein